MKNQLNSRIGQFALYFFFPLLLACENPLESINEESLYGTVFVQFSVSLDIVEKNARVMVNTDDFVVEFRTAAGDLYKSYERYADMEAEVALEPGSYYVSVHSAGTPQIAFNSPYYYAESDVFSIDYEETKTIQIEASLANCMVSVIYSQSVIDQFADYSTIVSSAEGSINFISTENRIAYFTPVPITIEATLIYLKSDSTEVVKYVTGQISEPQARYHYEIHIDSAPDQGMSFLSLSVDESAVKEIIELGAGSSTVIEGPIAYGALLINEIMYNPSALSDTEGEWFEIYNTTSESIDIFEMVIRNGTDIKHIINEHLVIEAQSYMVLAKDANATTSASYIYGSSLSLLNTGQDLTLANYGEDGTNGSIICFVDYSQPGFPEGNGASIILNPDFMDVESAKQASNWCVSGSAYETGDLGTPGTVNDVCL